jgi:transporter family protein
MNIPPLVIGGFIPAALLGLTTVLTRFSMGGGISIPIFLAAVGATIAVTGGAAAVVTGQTLAGGRAIGFAIATGLSWSGAIACISYGFSNLKLPVAIVAPLTNSNALVAVLLGAVLLSEWRSLNLPFAIAGTLCICGGATLVSLAR